MFNSNFQYNPYNSYNPYNPVSVAGINSPYQPQKQDIIKVNGREGANAYSLQPNSSVLLLDTNQPVIYLKQSDGGGYCNITAYKIEPIEQSYGVSVDTNDLEKRIRRLEELYESNTVNVTEFRQQKSVKSDKSNKNDAV